MENLANEFEISAQSALATWQEKLPAAQL